MELLSELLTDYLTDHGDAEPPLLASINRETHLKETRPHMLSGHYQGRILSMISRLLAPTSILEIGTFTGYATLCLSEGLAPQGCIHTIDINEELQERVQSYFEKSGLAAKIHYHIGPALEVIPTIPELFDLVFIDADKQNNRAYYDLVFDRVRPGGLILIDNVLWKGKVLEKETPDKQTASVLALNAYIAADQRTEKIMLPVRDGIFLIRKKIFIN
ncbi:Predicted O-methyltransferase YrrM [bacterium A37T11]|nr:Predicted O-methyltransferase YrrM [bacterium A37T11]